MKKISETQMQEFVDEFAKKMKKEQEDNESFWNSHLCVKMIENMKVKKEGFDSEEFSYFPEKVKARLGWEHLDNDDIKKFINVMSLTTIGLENDKKVKEDEDCMFEKFSFIKCGINVSVLCGQGSIISLSPVV